MSGMCFLVSRSSWSSTLVNRVRLPRAPSPLATNPSVTGLFNRAIAYQLYLLFQMVALRAAACLLRAASAPAAQERLLLRATYGRACRSLHCVVWHQDGHSEHRRGSPDLVSLTRIHLPPSLRELSMEVSGSLWTPSAGPDRGFHKGRDLSLEGKESLGPG